MAKKHGGKRENAGRKSKAEELGLAALLEDCFTDKDRRECIKALAKDCKDSDFHIRHESRKLLLAYTFGKPKDSMDITSKGEAIQTLLVLPKTDDGEG